MEDVEACAGRARTGGRPTGGPPAVPRHCDKQAMRLETCLAKHQAVISAADKRPAADSARGGDRVGGGGGLAASAD